METEIKSYAATNQGMPRRAGSQQSQERGMAQTFPQRQCTDFRFLAPELQENTFLLLQATDVWQFVKAALGDKHSC